MSIIPDDRNFEESQYLFDTLIFKDDIESRLPPNRISEHVNYNNGDFLCQMEIVNDSDEQNNFISNYEIACLITRASSDWLIIFLDKILPRLPNVLQDIYHIMVKDASGLEKATAAILIYDYIDVEGFARFKDLMKIEFTDELKTRFEELKKLKMGQD
jgi:hypothetical protein